jgi:hypothetical protein
MPVEPSLIGRTADLEAVSSALIAAASGAGPNTVLVSGTSGAGTSALTRRAADLLVDRFPDGRLVLDAAALPAQIGRTPSGPSLLGWALHQLGIRGGDVPQSVAGRSAAYRAMLARRRMLILVDNAISADQFAALAPWGSVSALLVAARSRALRAPNAIRIDVSPLPTPDGLAVLAATAGAERIAAESADAIQLVTLCEGLPLALRAVGTRLAGDPGSSISKLADAMSDDQRRLDLLDVDGLSMRTSIARSAAGLATVSRHALRAMGVSPPGGMTARTLAARMSAPATQVWQALEELTDVRLATALRAGRYDLSNELIRRYAAEYAVD